MRPVTADSTSCSLSPLWFISPLWFDIGISQSPYGLSPLWFDIGISQREMNLSHWICEYYCILHNYYNNCHLLLMNSSTKL